VYSGVTRSYEYKQRLLDFIKRAYGIKPLEITPAKRGFYGETWRLQTADADFFVKLVYPAAHRGIYESSFPVIKHLCDHGIDFISRVVPSINGALSARFDGAALGVFDWINGENMETDDTKIPEYRMLARVYAVPSGGLRIRQEDFSGNSAGKFFRQWEGLHDKQLLSLLEKNRSKLEHRAERLRHFSALCQSDTAGFFITHGDAGGNLMRDGNRYFIVDWDYPLLAPPERDAWVMCSRDWAREAFQNALAQNGIAHILRKERLAYYCYYFFFFYLAAYLDGFTRFDTAGEIEAYIDGWIEASIQYADAVF